MTRAGPASAGPPTEEQAADTPPAPRAAFEADLGFRLDRFQHRAMDAIDRGESVLVSAPTGSGKTLVADYAVARALAGGGKAFYTTPIKALSNQKFAELSARYGAARVGLLTRGEAKAIRAGVADGLGLGESLGRALAPLPAVADGSIDQVDSEVKDFI